MTNNTQRWIRMRLFAEQPTCAYCRTPLRRRSATLDHLVPISRGGVDSLDNAVLACIRCNECKGNRTLIEWCADILNAAAESGVLA